LHEITVTAVFWRQEHTLIGARSEKVASASKQASRKIAKRTHDERIDFFLLDEESPEATKMVDSSF
jgi:hypothetical protein